MQPPPRDELGVIPHDHPDISADEALVRYIHRSWIEQDNGAVRISSAAFTQSSPPDNLRNSVSVEIKKLLLAEGKVSPFNAKTGLGYAELVTGCVREVGCLVGWDPEPDNSAHGGIWGVGKSKSKRRQLSRSCVVLIIPPTVEHDI